VIRGRLLSAGCCEGVENRFVRVNYCSDSVKSMTEACSNPVRNVKETARKLAESCWATVGNYT
jgi:hypothetical protein